MGENRDERGKGNLCRKCAAATWQGNLHWLEGDKESAFRSELELLSLMDSVLDLTREKKRNSN